MFKIAVKFWMLKNNCKVFELSNAKTHQTTEAWFSRACEQAASEASCEVTRKLAAISRVGLLLSCCRVVFFRLPHDLLRDPSNGSEVLTQRGLKTKHPAWIAIS